MTTATKTETARIAALREANVPRGVSLGTGLYAVRASGATLWDADGREFIDFAGGIGVLNTGHTHPRVVRAVQEQAANLTHSCFQVVGYEGYVTLAERLNKLVLGDFAKKTLFLSSGAEAVENAVKIARAATGRPAVIAFEHGYHGRTLLTMTLTSKEVPYKSGFGPFAPAVYRAPLPYALRGVSTEEALAGLRDVIEQIGAENVAAMIIEPVLGEGGFLPMPDDFLRGIRAECDRTGALMIADEIQSGFGRTGKMLAMEHSGVVPDLTTTAKSLAGGLPLSAVTGRAEVMDAPIVGGLGGTYAGNPLAIAAAHAVLDAFEQDDVLAQGERLAAKVRAVLGDLKAKHAQIAEVRGLGAMLAFELVKDAEMTPDADAATKIVDGALERGLILLKTGPYGNVIRILVPLTANSQELERGLGALEAAVGAVLA
ncbi:5-aminovalerate aminotransferase DavT [Deinococcus xinjiangensis]|uniref:5-aminovalerate aminotransferase DavT n=1 Tax=Deinococcus xinjiangensis TaxID=457454 RepID=A0ABP9V5H4_9DEIO